VTLRENAVLTKISLIGNGIGPAGALALAGGLRANATLQELGLGWNGIGNEGAVAIAKALRCNGVLERLDLRGNSISDKGATAIFEALTESNCSLTWLNLKRNAEISQRLQNDIDFMLVSCRVLKSFCKHLCKPVDKKLIPLVINGLQLTSVCHENPELVHSQETTTGPIFLLVRAMALHDSKVVTAAPPSRRGSIALDK
jgi:Leucine Rich repeat